MRQTPGCIKTTVVVHGVFVKKLLFTFLIIFSRFKKKIEFEFAFGQFWQKYLIKMIIVGIIYVFGT